MITVKFDNPGGSECLIRHNRVRFDIPACGSMVVDLPDTEATKRLISNVARRYRPITAKVLLAEEGETPLSPEAVSPDGAICEPSTSTEELICQEPTDERLSLDEFSSGVSSVLKGSSGWWSVIVTGIDDPYKVRPAKTEDEAVGLAYKEYEADNV